MNNKYLQKKSKQETAGKSDRQNRSEGHYARKKESFKEIPKWTPIAILVFTTLIYIKALFNDFAWDDEIYIMRNPFLRDFSINGIKVIFTSFYFSNFHPITTLTYFLEYKCFGINPFPYHLVNILLHLLNTWLVFKLVEQLSNKKITALVVSLLFAVHPMHVESVAWISERKDILYSLFYFLSLLSYLRYVKHGFSVKHYIWTLLFFIASLLSKSAAVTLPVLLIGIDIFRKRKIFSVVHKRRRTMNFYLVYIGSSFARTMQKY
ncbi:MAG: glycosyltransferase family 39 protein [Bacteroidetes bacterium]|nr:glycosyltransferase family 39 protein [Bacteroidota bacterium]